MTDDEIVDNLRSEEVTGDDNGDDVDDIHTAMIFRLWTWL
jgi:hypothetical protein